MAECPLLAQSGHHNRAERYPLLGVKRTSAGCCEMFAYDPTAMVSLPTCCMIDRASTNSSYDSLVDLFRVLYPRRMAIVGKLNKLRSRNRFDRPPA
jgi:hypothetical protein